MLRADGSEVTFDRFTVYLEKGEPALIPEEVCKSFTIGRVFKSF
jgi:hypothetical protein